ncbi:uncharacterized protein STEHIDRAFT_150106 [Stereum hirsutum FP-91666 SS1]|uniref:uncharacterized protein n=1 Tax=Stereum hirsutum (strain FP-91666) TaxID=721885 RepID=UPI00044491ED|nr:uncharacterized protein STEHIDRAFT_150106 [Stereum hirsutum FP-91666 SS1]EIM81034.1 hypothetical protein STEHIDRAFT_150106 [Stereum hirsutum FP-91666 SS1]
MPQPGLPRINIIKWRRLLGEHMNPERIIDVLSFGPVLRSPNRWGDTVDDLPGLINALKELADAGGSSWDKLVFAGMVGHLCKAILWLHRDEFRYGEHTSGQQQQHRHMALCDFTPALGILVAGAFRLRPPLSLSQQRFVQEIKEHWSWITRRLWTDPQNSLRPEQPHIGERADFARMLLAIVLVDPTLLSIIDNPGDLTVPILSRMLVYTSGLSDFLSLSVALATVFYPLSVAQEDSAIYEYRQAHPAALNMFDSFLLGLPNRSFSAFFDFILDRLPHLPTYELSELCGMLDSLCHKAQWGSEADTIFIRYMCGRSSSIFSYLFAIFRDPAMVKPTEGHSPNAFMPSIMRLVAYLTNQVTSEWTEQSQPFIRICRQARLFDALEGLLVHGRHWQQSLEPFGTIISSICGMVLSRPFMIPLLRVDLPRPQLMRHILDILYDRTHENHRWLQQQRNIGSFRAVMFSLTSLRLLEIACRIYGHCMRRGCTKKRRARCKDCHLVEYCGPVCQRLDWKEHRLICGLVINVEGSTVTDPQRFPFRFIQEPSNAI